MGPPKTLSERAREKKGNNIPGGVKKAVSERKGIKVPEISADTVRMVKAKSADIKFDKIYEAIDKLFFGTVYNMVSPSSERVDMADLWNLGQMANLYASLFAYTNRAGNTYEEKRAAFFAGEAAARENFVFVWAATFKEGKNMPDLELLETIKKMTSLDEIPVGFWANSDMGNYGAFAMKMQTAYDIFNAVKKDLQQSEQILFVKELGMMALSFSVFQKIVTYNTTKSVGTSGQLRMAASNPAINRGAYLRRSIKELLPRSKLGAGTDLIDIWSACTVLEQRGSRELANYIASPAYQKLYNSLSRKLGDRPQAMTTLFHKSGKPMNATAGQQYIAHLINMLGGSNLPKLDHMPLSLVAVRDAERRKEWYAGNKINAINGIETKCSHPKFGKVPCAEIFMIADLGLEDLNLDWLYEIGFDTGPKRNWDYTLGPSVTTYKCITGALPTNTVILGKAKGQTMGSGAGGAHCTAEMYNKSVQRVANYENNAISGGTREDIAKSKVMQAAPLIITYADGSKGSIAPPPTFEWLLSLEGAQAPETAAAAGTVAGVGSGVASTSSDMDS